MGDGGVACVPSQHVMEPFSVCGGKSTKNNGSTTTTSSNTTTPTSTSKLSKNPKVKTKMKMKAKRDSKDKVAVEFSGKREVLDSKNVNSSVKGINEVECNGKDVNKDEVEEGELGTMDIENGRVLVPEKSFQRKFELKSEIEKGEFVPSGKWRRGDVEKGEFYPRSVEKGEFFPDRERWRRNEVAVKDEYDYSRTRRYDSGKDKGWNGDREWTPPSSGKYWTDKDKGWKGDREWTPPSGKYSNDKDKAWKGDREWSPPSGKYSNDKEKAWKGDREWTPPSGKYSNDKDKGWKGDREWTPPSGKYSNDKEVNRSGNQQSKRPSRFEGNLQDRAPRISSKIVDEEGSFKYEPSNGKNHGREYSSGNRWKRHGGDSDGSDRKHRGDFVDYTSSKIRKLSDDGNRSAHSSEKYSQISMERPYKNSSSSFRNVSSDKYSSRHYDSSLSSRNVYDRHINSPHHLERSPHDRARYQEQQDWSPARRDKSPFDRSRHHDHSKSPYNRSRHYDHSRSPFDRSRPYDHRNQSPSYSERSPHDQDPYHERRDRTPSFAELSPLDRSRPREITRRSGATEKRQSYYGSKGLEEKDNQKDHNRRDLQSSAKEYKDKSNPHEDVSIAITLNDQTQKDKLPEVPNANPKETPLENGVTEELASMEEDMDICNTPPHVPAVADAVAGKWFYLDHFGFEHGPSRLSDLKRLVDEGLLVSDHFIKHIDSDRWVTVEHAVSPMVTANFPSIVSDTVTQLVSPPEAPGNLLADNGAMAKSSNQLADEVSVTSLDPLLCSTEIPENLLIDHRVGALLEGVTVIPGKELETVGEVLQMTFENWEWERWVNREGEHYDIAIGEGLSTISELASGEAADSGSTLLASSEKDRAVASGDTNEWFSGLWSCRGGDWKRSDETLQDRSLKKRLVLNDGYPLCQMPKFGYEDPRVQQKDELYYPSQSRRLDLPPWAFTSPDEWHDRSSQIKLALGRGVKGTMLSVIRINACVVKDHGSFVSEPRTKVKGKERYPSKASLPYLSTGDMKRLSEDSVPLSKRILEPDTEGAWKTRSSFGIPKDHVCTADELQLHIGDWYYLDGFGHEHGPLTFREMQILANQGLIQKHSSVFRKVDRIWVPISSFAEASPPTGQIKHDNDVTSTDTSGALLSESSSAVEIGTNRVSGMFHDLHPQFIGYTRGKLHELVMKSYKSREFAAAINEFLDPWISARQPRKEIDKNIYNSSFFQKSDQFRASKRARIDESEENYDMEDVSANMKDDFDDLCGDATFSEVENVEPETEGESCWVLDGRVLARVFHFLRADTRSLVNATLTCKSWRSVVRFYKSISTQVDLCSVGDSCNDSMIWSIMNDYDKGKIRSLLLRGCTSITSGVLEEVLRSWPHLSLIDIRGCNQFEDLACKYPNVNWIRSRPTHSKIRSLKQIEDGASSALKTYNALDSHVDESSGLRNYLESSDRRDSANQLFHRSLYKRSKLFDARKSSSILSRDAHLRRLAMRKYESGYKRMAEFLASSVKDIMKQNTFEFFVPKVAQIQGRIRNGYYAGRGLSSLKDDISRMCREAIKLKNRSNAKDMNHVITLFIRLATNLDGGSKSSYERDEMMQNSKEDSPPGFSSASSKYRKTTNKVTEKRYMNRSNGSLTNGVSDYGEYASDREIRRRLSKLNKKPMESGSETPDDFDRSSEESSSGSESTASETESDLESQSEGGTGESRGETYITSDDGFDSFADDREWGARMTKASLVPPVTRKYEVIDNYVIVADEDEVKRKMQAALPDDYTDKIFAQRNGIEESDMEIPEVKVYKPRKQLGTEVLEQEVYGIDPYTHNLLLDSMPEDSDWALIDKHMFIEDVLLRTLNKQVRTFTGIENVPMTYSLRPSFEELLETAEEDNDRRTMKLCQYVLKAIDSRPDDKYVAYRKGLGVVCNKEGGFGEEDFVVEFLGEVYPTWRWFEKQDGIRLLQKNSKDPAPEFYNIYLERPKGDADGYDLVVVDAMHKANYASRICHSCRPNCEAKVTAVDGQYQIGIYTVRPIQYGEEITFDYNSVTESKEEYEASVCLCGSQVCRGSYLNLTGEGAFLKVLMEYHGILDRLHLMLEACEVNLVTEEDYLDLGKAGLGSCLLGGLPDWLIAYSARLVRFINFERTKLPDEILKHNLEEKKKYFSDIIFDVEKCDAEVQAEGVYNQRLQNLALTLDKVRYVMKCVYGDPKKAPPPIERLNPREVVSFLWNGEGSLVEELIQCIDPHMDDNMLTNLKAKIRARAPSGFDNSQMELRKSLIWLRDEVRNLQCTYKCRHDAAADLIHIYAHTKCFFKIKEYKTVTSPSVFISPLDLGPKTAEKVGPNGHEYSKTYHENYCLGQLIYWYNQAYAEPDSCLARASRGCLSLPDIGSFYAKVQKPSRQRVYGPRTVKFMLARMEKQPQRPWPKDRIWSFNSSPKIIGSPMLDAVLEKAPLDKEMVHWLKHRPAIFQAMWDR